MELNNYSQNYSTCNYKVHVSKKRRLSPLDIVNQRPALFNGKSYRFFLPEPHVPEKSITIKDVIFRAMFDVQTEFNYQIIDFRVLGNDVQSLYP